MLFLFFHCSCVLVLSNAVDGVMQDVQGAAVICEDGAAWLAIKSKRNLDARNTVEIKQCRVIDFT